MEPTDQKRPWAWQPLTPKGVAAFAGAKLGRLLVAQFIFGCIAAAVVVWFLSVNWFPVIQSAILKLPASGEIRKGRLDWTNDTAQALSENHFLAVAVDLKHEGASRSPAHLSIEFGQSDLKIFSLLGFVQQDYGRDWVIPFNRIALEPWWGAWRPVLLGLAAGLTIGGLMITWAALATLYFLPVWLIGFFANRDLSFAGSWRLAGAALMPGALFFCLAIFAYGLGALDLVRLAAAGAVHLIIGWVYFAISPWKRPRHPAASPSLKQNPFKSQGSS